MEACMVCMYACAHIGVHYWQDGSRCEVVTRIETPRMGLSDGNPSYGSVGTDKSNDFDHFAK